MHGPWRAVPPRAVPGTTLSFTRLSSPPLAPGISQRVPSPPRARLSSLPPPWASSPSRSVTAPPVSAVPRSAPPPSYLFALYAFSFSPSPSATADVGDHKDLSIISENVSLILREIEASERRLHQIERELAGYETLNPAKPGLPPELKLILAHHPFPLGRNSRSGITTMVSSIAHSCARPAAVALLSTFMSYRHAASCPHRRPPPSLQAHLQGLRAPPLSSPPPASPFPDLSGTPTPRTPFQGLGRHGPGHCGL